MGRGIDRRGFFGMAALAAASPAAALADVEIDDVFYDGAGSHDGEASSDGGSSKATEQVSRDACEIHTADEFSIKSETLSTYEADKSVLLAEYGAAGRCDGVEFLKSGDFDMTGWDDDGRNSCAVFVESTGEMVGCDIRSDARGSDAVNAIGGSGVLMDSCSIEHGGRYGRAIHADDGSEIQMYGCSLALAGDDAVAVESSASSRVQMHDCHVRVDGGDSTLFKLSGDAAMVGVTAVADGSIAIDQQDGTAMLVGCDITAGAPSRFVSVKSGRLLALGCRVASQETEGYLVKATGGYVDAVFDTCEIYYDPEYVGLARSDGADLCVTLRDMYVAGNVWVDTGTAWVFVMSGGVWAGKVPGGSGDARVVVNEGGTWIVTGDCWVNELYLADGGAMVDSDGIGVSVVVDGEYVIWGDGPITVTVNSFYNYGQASERCLLADLPDASKLEALVGHSVCVDARSMASDASFPWIESEAGSETETEPVEE